MFFYRVYSNSAKATLVNGFIRMIGFLAFVFVFLDIYYNGDPNYIIAGSSILFMIAMFILSNKLSDKIANKDSEKEGEKRKDLLKDIVDEQGKVEDEILTFPATITLRRANSIVGFLVPFKYTLNG